MSVHDTAERRGGGGAPGEPAIAVAGLVKTYPAHDGAGRTAVLDGISFEVPAGAIVAFLGHNGAGKTTLIRVLSTLLRPDSGTVRVFGRDLAADPAGARTLMATTGQFAAVDENLTGEENLIFFGRLRGLDGARCRDRARELLDRFDLAGAGGVRVGDYSGGMRRRLDIAVSLVVVPRLLFLDEPTTGLDPVSRRRLWAMVRDLRDEGMTVVLTTQYLEEAAELADTVHLLRDHRILVSGSPDELRRRIGGTICTVTAASEAEAEALTTAMAAGRAPATTWRREGRRIIGDDPGDFGTLGAVTRAIDHGAPAPVSVNLAPPTLDDVFILLNTGEEGR